MILANEITSLLNAQSMHSPARSPSSELDKQAFLTLLVKQLSFQDPLEPMSNGEFVTQLAQFGSLEQTINLNTNFEKFVAFQALTQASTLIGRSVIALVNTEDGIFPVEGVVQQVMMINGSPYARLSDGSEIAVASIVSVEPADDTESGGGDE